MAAKRTRLGSDDDKKRTRLGSDNDNGEDNEELRQQARKIFQAGCRAVDPKTAVKRSAVLNKETNVLAVNGQSFALADYDEVFVLGVGKASVGMCEGLEEVLQQRLTRGVVVTKYGHATGHKLSQRFEVFEASHPTPDEAGVAASGRLLELAESANAKTLVFCLVSGGSSSLLVAPADGITLADFKEATKQLLECGCPVEQKNAVLKHMSRVKGGQLLAAAQPARVVTMILSDVVGDPLDAIGSGPTVPDTSTYTDCLRIVGSSGIFPTFPKACLDRLVRGTAGLIKESPKENDAIFKNAVATVVAANKTAVDAALDEAKALGFNTMALSTFLEGEAKEVAKLFSAIAKEEVAFNRPLPLPACIICGGETTVTLPEKPGVGGRNQLLALAAALEIDGLKGVTILSGGTDGGDGPKNDSAGAVVTGGDAAEAAALGLDMPSALRDCDAYTCFKRFEELKYGRTNVLHLRDGPTGTNVADVMILLVR
eukprot:TRINITY_DN3230_c0_g1_i1.p1 TRINITY_DN3230_c0_g1~~TRINITY_DN3230_c0_g1_i1.p1  ORF type:complete len:523 (-),score=104.67 TRINITY_DN3230_c0_g1_i1:93-1547(-)